MILAGMVAQEDQEDLEAEKLWETPRRDHLEAKVKAAREAARISIQHLNRLDRADEEW